MNLFFMTSYDNVTGKSIYTSHNPPKKKDAHTRYSVVLVDFDSNI